MPSRSAIASLVFNFNDNESSLEQFNTMYPTGVSNKLTGQ